MDYDWKCPSCNMELQADDIKGVGSWDGMPLCPDCAVPVEASKEPDLPGMGTRAKSLAKAVVRTVKHVVEGGEPLVDDVEKEIRESICQANVCGMYRESDNTCADCGCFLSVKIPIMAEYCPQLLWPGDDLKHEISGETDGEE